MEPVESFTHAGLTVEIHYDDNRSSPREWSNVGTMVCWHRRANLGDETIDPETYFEDVHPVDFFKRHGARVVLPLYLYEHSGMTMRTGDANPFGDPWDSGQVGFIYDTPEGVKECIGDGATDEHITAALKQEVEVYDQYLTGQVYGYVVKGPDGEDLDDDDSSCSDIYGLDYARSEGRSAAESCAEVVAREAEMVAYWAARDVMTVAS